MQPFTSFFQLQNRRTHYQDQMVLTNHNFTSAKLSNGGGEYPKRRAAAADQSVSGLTQLVLIINNWGFVRDTQHDSKVRPCTLSDFQVQLKLSSSAFRSTSNPDCEFPFDKQAANFPYDSFEQVLKSSLTKNFVKEVKQLYEETESPVYEETGSSSGDEEDEARGVVKGRVEEEEEEEEREFVPSIHKIAKRGAKK